MHKVIFNNRLLPSIEAVKIIPIEVIGRRRSKTAIHLVLDKKLISDIVNIRKLPRTTMYTDMTNCYSRVTYLFTSLCA